MCTKFSVWVNLHVKINVPSDCGIPEYVCDTSLCAEFNVVCTCLYSGVVLFFFISD